MKRKIALGTGILALIAVAFWMRALASWRPVTLAKVNFAPAQIHLSRDGKLLLLRDDAGKNAQILNLRTGQLNPNPRRSANFFEENGLRTFPRVSPVRVDVKKNTIYSPRSGGVNMTMASVENAFRLAREGHEGFQTAVSKPRSEIYCELFGSIWIFEAKDKKFKKRVPFTKKPPTRSVFSPDGQQLFTVEDSYFKQGSVPMDYLRLYDVQTGKLEIPQLPEIDRLEANSVRGFGFSPDSKFIWFTGSGGPTVIRIANREVMFSLDSTGPVKWLPDGRIGLVTRSGFEFHDAKGHRLKTLPGPFNNPNTLQEVITDWAISPDENWIYSAEQSGTIRRWRAR